MEVEEETTSNLLEDSIAAETTTVVNEILIRNTTAITDNESETELKELISEQNSPVSVHKSEDSEAFIMAAVGENEGRCTDSVSVSALSGCVENSVVVESVNVAKDSNGVDDDAVKEIDVLGDDVAPVECGGSEINGEDDKVLKDCEGDEVTVTDQFNNESDSNIQLEDVGSDGGDVKVDDLDNVEGDEAVTEEKVVEEVVKEEEMVVTEEQVVVVEVVKEEEQVAVKEEEALGVEQDVEKEGLLANEKSLDVEMETEKSLDNEIEIETEKSLDDEIDIENEKSLDTEMENEKSLDTEMENEEEANLGDDDKAEEAEIETGSSTKGGGRKRKRGKATPRKTIEEDVCFICFDGGDLVLCDRR